MSKIKELFLNIIRFFPLQLVLIQLKKSHFMVGIWIVFMGIISQNLGTKYGIPYLFLSPEYLGEVSWMSYLILGFALGGFFMAYHLYSYIILGPYFPFLVTFSRPFYKFSINNSFFPLLLYILLVFNIYDVQCNEELISLSEVILEIVALTTGIILFIILSVLYFFQTNLDVFKLKRRREQEKAGRSLYSRARTLFTRENFWFHHHPNVTYQPNHYFGGLFKIARARQSKHYDRTVIRDIFRQNHLNASFFELALLVSFIVMGLFQDYSLVVIPSGASFFLLSTIILMVVTIFYSWFRTWAASLIVLSLISLNYFSKGTGFLQSDNKAYGLTYNKRSPYNLERLKQIQYSQEVLVNDIKIHENILENWKKKAIVAQQNKKPKLIIVNCSGGGLRAAMWTHYLFQELDEKTRGTFFKSTHLITGASGGMVGAAYYRDVYNSTHFAERLANRQNYLDDISRDLLNRVAFNLASHDIFLRYRRYEEEGEEYLKDRGYSFENQLNKNTHFLMDKTLLAYQSKENSAEIPLMIFSPTIINDGRRLIIGTQPYSFLNGTEFQQKNIGPENIEYLKLFEDHHPLKIKFTSVLRMNSTFPYILPMVALPTSPEIHVMDAGIRDNYGTKSTMRYIAGLQDWLKSNTSGVIVVEMRDIDKDYDMVGNGEFTLYDRITKPFSNFYGNFYQSQEFNATELIENTKIKGLPIDVVTFILRKDPTEKIALSWHLTQREKNDIVRTFLNSKNQIELKKLLDLLKS